MIIKFDIKGSKHEQIPFQWQESAWWQHVVTYALRSDYRQVTHLKEWLQTCIATAEPELVDLAKELKRDTHDDTVITVLKWIRGHIAYVSDKQQYNLTEFWATPYKVYTTKQDDCEGGGVLLYVLCRLAGVPENRLLCMCGTVIYNSKSAGHFWVAYRPDSYPLNWAFLDWCWFPTLNPIHKRNLFYINKNTIVEYKPVGPNSWERIDESSYRTMWFAFNEQRSYVSFVKQ